VGGLVGYNNIAFYERGTQTISGSYWDPATTGQAYGVGIG
jgi:hypothetical protein